MVGLWEEREQILLGPGRQGQSDLMKNKLYNTILYRPILIHIVKEKNFAKKTEQLYKCQQFKFFGKR